MCHSRFWERSAKTCWELMSKHRTLHKEMSSSKCEVHAGHSCYALLEWSDQKLKACWGDHGMSDEERRTLIADDAAPLVHF